MNLPKVSIIATSYTLDRFKDITELLDGIQAQTYKNLETLIVTEGSPELLKRIRAYVNEKGYSKVQVLSNKGERGSYPSRNLGIRRARGEVIAFIDDDALPFPNWVEEMARTYIEDSSIIGLTGPILPLWEQDSMAWFPVEFYWIFSCTYWGWRGKREVRNGYCTNLSFRREAFDSCGFFKTSIEVEKGGKSDWQQPGGEETEFCLRVKQKTGKRIIYDPNMKVKHRVYGYRLSTRFIAKRAYWEGYAKALLNEWYRSSESKVLATEYSLLRRILFRLLPNSLRLLFCQPGVALHRLWVTFLVLLGVGAGYCAGSVRNLIYRISQ
jgi:glycosyltransferase involved in cell wall biosynthesis